MDLNTALMESITNMSEYFVAANTRTSFTDLADSSNNSFGALNNNNTTNNLDVKPNIHSSGNMVQSAANPFCNNSIANVQKQLSPASADHLGNLSPVPNSHQFDSINSLDSSPLQHSSTSFQSHINLDQNLSNPYRNKRRSSSAMQAQQISQPARSQIPIHCYIEQFDARVDMPSYQPTLTDNDLFKTANPSDSTKASTSKHDLKILNNSNNNSNNNIINNNNINNNNSNINNSPHLHQSKLALESVTNCNQANTNIPRLDDSNLFDDNDPTDLDCIDANLEHLESGSPLSIPPPTNELHSSGDNGYQQTSNLCNDAPDGHSSNTCYNNDNESLQSARETYVIISANVLFIDLLRTVMQQLGFTPMEQLNAKVLLQVRNWKPIALDQVSEDKVATVGQVLGDISSFVTLRIKIYNSVDQGPTEWTETMIRQVVLDLTQNMSQLMLSKLCNISQPLISSIVRGGKRLGRKKCQEFGQWYLNYIQSADVRPPATQNEISGGRLVFDKTREIPRLKAWFATNTKPSEELFEEYSRLMNEDALRKDRPQVSARALKNWWKNERQKLGIRQREIRGRPKLKQTD